MGGGFTRRGVLSSLLAAPVAIVLKDEFGIESKKMTAPRGVSDDQTRTVRLVLLGEHENEITKPIFAPNKPGTVVFEQDGSNDNDIYYWACDLEPEAQALLGQRYYKQRIPRDGLHRLSDGHLSLEFRNNIIEYTMI